MPFAGWEMPVQYAGVKPEALAVRNDCGLFDVGHMGQFDVRGHGVTEALNNIVSADWGGVAVGRAAYALLLNESGGVHDDILGYRLGDEHWLIVVNASRADDDEAYFRTYLPGNITLEVREPRAMIAIQGPRSAELMQALCDAELSEIHWRDVREVTLCGAGGIIARGGYTGSDGFEWMGRSEDAPAVWQALRAAGAMPCGLGARDVLRLEAGLPLYGHELRAEWTPDASSCAWAVKADKQFIGREGLMQSRATPAAKRIRGLQMLGRGLGREGYVVRDAATQNEIGEVTSGTLSPVLECGIALAMLPTDLGPGSEVAVDIRGTMHPAKVVKPPFVTPARKA